MKIGISLLSAKSKRTGLENAAFNLIMQLNGMQGDDEYVIYADVQSHPWLSSLSKRIQVIDVKLSSRRAPWMWEHLYFLTSDRPKEMDVVHFPMGGGVVGYRGRFTLTIHDLNHYVNKDLTMLRRHLLWRLWYKANVKRAAKIITVSEHVKGDILREFPLKSDVIRVIPNGVDRRFKPCAPSEEFRVMYHLPQRYVLFVGRTTTNKNLRRAIDAMSLARRKYDLDHRLVIAGLPGEDDARLKNYVRSNSLQETVQFIGYVSDNDLPQLYSNAQLFLFPSTAEGFGIPPLEAMRCGIPVVATQTSCMPEVLGDAPIWVDPFSVESIADGIGAALLDKGLRIAAVAKGMSRAEGFSWTKMASETINVYREAAGCPVAPIEAAD